MKRKMEAIDDESVFLNPVESATYPVSRIISLFVLATYNKPKQATKPSTSKRAKVAANASEPKRRSRKRKGQGIDPGEEKSLAQSNDPNHATNGGGNLSAPTPAEQPRSPLKISIRLPTSMRAPPTASKPVDLP
jgi:hypothetical protein